MKTDTKYIAMRNRDGELRRELWTDFDTEEQAWEALAKLVDQYYDFGHGDAHRTFFFVQKALVGAPGGRKPADKPVADEKQTFSRQDVVDLLDRLKRSEFHGDGPTPGVWHPAGNLSVGYTTEQLLFQLED